MLLYSLLIAERFKEANPENILLYIMTNPAGDGFENLRARKFELDNLILARNELAKWQKLNQTPINFLQGKLSSSQLSQKSIDIEDLSELDSIVKLPNMTS